MNNFVASKRKRGNEFSTSLTNYRSSMYIRKLACIPLISGTKRYDLVKILSSGDLVAIEASDHARNGKQITFYSTLSLDSFNAAKLEKYEKSSQSFYDILNGSKPYKVATTKAILGKSEEDNTFFVDVNRDFESKALVIIVSQKGRLVLFPIIDDESSDKSKISLTEGSIPFVSSTEEILFCCFSGIKFFLVDIFLV